MQQRHPILSLPMRVYWAGWESDTLKLQREGWQLSAEQDVRDCSLRVAMKHDAMRCVAVSQRLQHFYFEEFALGDRYGRADAPPLVIQYFASRLNLNIIETGYPQFKPIDAAPQFLSNSTIHNYEDLKWFAAPLVETKELIVDADKVGEILAKIAEAQLPEQEQIRRRAAMREAREGMSIESVPRRAFHAQVLSLAA